MNYSMNNFWKNIVKPEYRTPPLLRNTDLLLDFYIETKDTKISIIVISNISICIIIIIIIIIFNFYIIIFKNNIKFHIKTTSN